MAQQVATQDKRAVEVRAHFRSELSRMMPEFAKLLPAHIPPERFERVVLTTWNNPNNKLIQACDLKSLWHACSQACEDALLPDGREGAIVPFRNKDGDLMAQWIPMVMGIRKLVRQSGELRELRCDLVYVGEPFEHEEGDDFFIKHKKVPFDGDPAKRPVVCCYETARDKNGHKLHHELMWENELMAIAARSKSFKSGPWSDPLFALEMRKKTVTKRHFKQLPTSRDLDRVLRRDDELYSFGGETRRQEITTLRGNTSAGQMLQQFARGPERIETKPKEPEPAEEMPPIEEERQEIETEGERQEERAAESSEPKTSAEYATAFREYLKTAHTAGAIDAKWKKEKDMRNKLNMEPELRNALDSERKARIAELAAKEAGQ
jgi:recombination protein RecT